MNNKEITTPINLNPDTLSLVFEHLDSAIILSSLERRIVSMNKAAQEIFGYDIKELKYKSTRILYTDEEQFKTQGKKWFNPSASYSNETRIVNYKTKNGRIFKGQTTGGPIKNEVDKSIFFVVIVKDDSSRIDAEDTLNILHTITSSRQLSFEQRIIAILKLGCNHFGLPIGIFSQIIDNKYIIQHAIHPDDSLDTGLIFDLGITYCSHVYKANDVQGFHHVSDSLIKTHPCFENFGLEAYLGAPIFVDGDRFGTLNFSSPNPTRPFIRQDIELVRLFAEWVGHEIARNNDLNALKKAHQQLELIANTDALTGLANRGSIECALKKSIKAYQHLHCDLTIAIFDFDYFKSINDTYGHDAGDSALKQFSSIVKRLCRKEDLYGRWGGEEFLAIYPNTDLDGTKILLNRLTQELSNSGIVYQEQKINLTTSIGVTSLRPEDNHTEFLKRADSLLYKAKSNGRNRIETG